MKNPSPFDRERFVGYVSSVTPTSACVTFPNPKLLDRFFYDGDILQGGLVGNYIVIEGYGYGLLAKTIKVELSDKSNTYKSLANLKESTSHPVAIAEFQLSFDSFSLEGQGAGIVQYPEIGAKAYACPASILSKLIDDFGRPLDSDNPPDDLLELACLDSNPSKRIRISANALLSRHCAIVGTTGSGKSYTTGKLIEELCKKDNAKIIILDATGEFEDFATEPYCQRLAFGDGGDTYFPYQQLTENDLFALFRPSGQSQEPTLQQAIRSLKLAKLEPEASFVDEGLIKKPGLSKKEFGEKYTEHLEEIEGAEADFDINKLMQQIEYECVYDSGGSFSAPDFSVWGKKNDSMFSYCSSLIKRVSNLRAKTDISKLFGFNESHISGYKKFLDEFEDFYKGDKKLLVVDLSKISSEANVKDIFSNAVGRYLLEGVRKQADLFKEFTKKPLILMVDEAHQIFEINKVKDEYSNEFKLDAFEKIAKESRKFGLFLCLSTQRPADIPAGVLSQMGTFIAHRLINERDIQAIRNSVQDSSAGVLSFLPSFKKGQALLTGNEFPMPIVIQTNEIEGVKPRSRTPILFENTGSSRGSNTK